MSFFYALLATIAPIILPIIALGLDAIFKDPRFLPHPVQVVGWLAAFCEPRARKFSQRGLVCVPGVGEFQAGYIAGVFYLVLILLLTGLVVYFLCNLPLVGFILTAYFAYAGLALGSLLREGELALKSILHDDILTARATVAMLVSRDLSSADKETLYRTLAETLSENFNDALIAPFFWLLVGGPVGLWVYKAVSTMDSLWGYRSDKWYYLGWASARLDDVMAWIPARISAILLGIFSRFIPHAGIWPGLLLIKKDAANMESPNAGWPMSAAAWLHKANMGGAAVYFGQEKQKPRLGPAKPANNSPLEEHLRFELMPWDECKITELLKHLRIAGLGGCVLMWLVWLVWVL